MWIAHYQDASELRQYNADGSENRYQDIDRSRLASFSLHTQNGEKLLEVHLEPGQRLIYRRRVAILPGEGQIVVYLVGWQQTVNGQNVQSIAHLFPDGHIELTGRYRDDHPWFYAPELFESEL